MAQTLTTNIVINAQTGNGFSQVGATLTELGSLVNGISSQLIEFGKDSVNVYRDYEKSMKDAEVALSTTYGRNTAELSTVMGQLDTYATEWAASTIFHTNDVANAISEAAHAGWDFDHIMAGIPAAMQLAQAGGLDLSEAVNYIVKSSNALGLELGADGEALSNFIDLWAFAANSSASTIGEFGDAMLRMGSTMRFAGSTEELMTLIAVTANAGQTGSEAGTLIRNSMMRLVAPTDKAKKAMEELGATSQESSELMEDQALAAANARLAASGFSAFDENGNLKNVLDIYRELYLALGEVAGGFDDIDKNEDALEILGAIFPTRTITEALTLIRAASEGYQGLYDAMMKGEAEGYGAYAAEKRMSTLDGAIERFESKVERLKQITGEELSGPLIDGLETLGGVVDDIAGLDEGTFSALVSGMEVIAAAGPGLLAAGAAFRFIGLAMNPITAGGLGLLAVVAAANALESLADADLESKFGNMKLDDSAIVGYISGLGAEFDEAYAQVDAFRTALDQSVASYETAAQTFSGNLLQDMLTKNQLTPEDIAQYQTLGQQMGDALKEGLYNSSSANLNYWEVLFGGEGVAEENESFGTIRDELITAYDESIAEAEAIGNKLREAMNKAFADGSISEDEYANILSYVQSYNDAIARAEAEARDEADFVERQKLLEKAQTASLEEIEKYASETVAMREARIAEENDKYDTARLGVEYRAQQAEEGGDTERAQRLRASLEEGAAEQKKRISKISAEYDDFLLALYDSQMRQSQLGDAYTDLESLASQVMYGGMTADEAVGSFSKNYGFWQGGAKGKLDTLLQDRIEQFGGYEGIQQKIQDYLAAGDQQHANDLLSLYTMAQIAAGFETESKEQQLSDQANAADYWTGREERQNESVDFINQSAEQIQGRQPTEEQPASEQQASSQPTEIEQPATVEMPSEPAQQPPASDVNAGFETPSQFVGPPAPPVEQQQPAGPPAPTATVETQVSVESTQVEVDPVLANGGDVDLPPTEMSVIPEVDESSLPQMEAQPLPVAPYVEGTDAIQSLQDQGFTAEVDVEGDTTNLSATISAYDAMNLLEYVDGDASLLSAAITTQDGRTITTNVDGNTSGLRSAINALGNQTVYVNVVAKKVGFAAGGRATTASIFGEAGPEWAIPEEHTARTADLLNSAMTASGFTWAELAAMYGGGVSNTAGAPASGGGTTIVYSPTIHAENVSGVSDELKADKKRLDQWYQERMLRDRMEVFA